MNKQQELQDAAAVGTALAEIEGYEGGRSQEWAAAHASATTYIDGLYAEWAPHVGEAARHTGRALGAVGLALAEVRYGKDEHRPRLYGGSVEQNVLATYHHGAHSRRFLRDMFAYASAVNAQGAEVYGAAALGRFPATAAFHDLIMGNGRGNDERQSRLLLAAQAQRLGITAAEFAPMGAGIDATTWSDERKAQAVDPAGPYAAEQRAAAVADLLSLFTRHGPYEAACVIVEDMGKQMHGRALSLVARERGFSLSGASIDECTAFIDSSPKLRTMYGTALQGQAGFFANFTPADPNLDALFPGRPANIAFMRELAAFYHSPRPLSALGTLALARDYASSL